MNIPRLAYAPEEVAEALGITAEEVLARGEAGEWHALTIGTGRDAERRIAAATLPSDVLDALEGVEYTPPEPVISPARPPYYRELLDEQGGRCAICGRHPRSGNLVIDHDHATGYVRGLLCTSCNAALGLFRDDTARIEAAIRYLTDNPIAPRQILYAEAMVTRPMPTSGRARNEGSIALRSDGRWQARATLNGRRLNFYGATREEAARKRAKAVIEAEADDLGA